ncbi:MAG: FkbM family methyltransferase [Chitinophagaceae bacterium]
MARIKAFIKETIISLLPKAIITEINSPFINQNVYYSQEGEDIILDRIFEGQQRGFYMDIGSHHPIRFSNTHKFYLKGWNGINIDATPGSMLPFKDIRPRDINIEIGISSQEGEMDYFIMDEPALNTFSKDRVDQLISDTTYKLKETVTVKTRTLEQVMKQYVPLDQHIDFLTIDVEGLDFEILHSNDWNKYRPCIVLLEDLHSSIENVANSELYLFMKGLKYELLSRTYNTVFFRDLLHK